MAASAMRALINNGSRSKHKFLQIALPQPPPWLAHLCSLATTLACASLLANLARVLRKALCSLSLSSLLPWLAPSCENATLQQRQQARERTGEQRKGEKVFIRLPWLGTKSAAFRDRIHRATIEALPDCMPVCTFTTRRLFNTCKKDVILAESLSNVIYFLNCACEQSYVGRTSQRLEERIKQHIPASLVKAAESQKAEPKKKGKKKRKKKRRRRQQRLKAVPVQREGPKKRT